MTDPILANDFPPATRDEWLRRVEGVLKGADFNRKLVGRPMTASRSSRYTRRPKAPTGRSERTGTAGASPSGSIIPIPQAANALALADLAGGADALTS